MHFTFSKSASRSNDDENYKSVIAKAQNIVVTNDCAEKGVKLGTDFLQCAKKKS